MNKNMLAILLCVISLGFVSSCGKKSDSCKTEKTCQTRYSYDECDACYELDAQTADVEADVESEDEAIRKF